MLALSILHLLLCISNVETRTLLACDLVHYAHFHTITIVGTMSIYHHHFALTWKIHEIMGYNTIH